MNQALYRKYRSKSLDEIVGQEHITTTLKNAIKSGKISHAYLFTGPRGVGKTSIARILAHEFNKFAYENEANHLDIIEIDAASNRRIDEIRDLRDKVHIAPTSGTYKIYIIDEVHMLTKEAFNALLKTLEEPPAHVIFILATTEAHKLPETIISRTQRFNFKPIDKQKVVEHLRSIADTEKMKIDDEALQLIAEHGEGSFRDSISLLDQTSSQTKNITVQNVQKTLGIAPSEVIEQLLNAISGSSPGVLLTILSEMQTQGYQAGQIAKQLGSTLREGLLANSSTLEPSEIITLLKNLINVSPSSNPDRMLEIILLEVVTSHQETTVSRPKPDIPTYVENTPLPETIQQAISTNKPKPAAKGTFSLEVWQNVLESLKSHHNTLYGVLRISKPTIEGNTLTLEFQFEFHQKRINEAKNMQLLNDAIKEFVTTPIIINCVIGNKAANAVPREYTKSKSQSKDSIDTISNIFGSAEVLES